MITSADEFSRTSLETYLSDALGLRGASVTAMEQLVGGYSRETWAVHVEQHEDSARELVVRRDPAGGIVATPLYKEVAVYRALAPSSVPVPTVLGYHDGNGLGGRPFYVMERLPGSATPRDVIALTPEAAGALADELAATLARIHAVPITAFGDDATLLGGASEARDQVEHWASVIEQNALEAHPVLTAATEWLRANAPRATEPALVHGDYRVGNVLVDGGKLEAVLDWEMAHVGDPMEDLGWFCMQRWQWKGEQLVGGLVPPDRFLSAYAAAAGIELDRDRVRFWTLLGNLKLAAIQLVSARRLAEGSARRLALVQSARFVEHQSLFVTETLLECLR